MNRLIFVIILLLIILGCDNQNEDLGNYNFKDVDTITVSKAEGEKQIKLLSNIACNSRIVYLETKEESIIGEISKIRIINNVIVILDRKITNTLYLFDLTGKFINKINKIGKGPNEYQSIIDFDINTSSNSVDLLVMPPKIMRFNLSGNLLDEIEFNFRAISIASLSKNLWLLDCGNMNNAAYDSDDAKLVFHDNKGIVKMQGEILGKNLKANIPTKMYSFFQNNRLKYFIPDYQNYIYILDSTNLSAKYYVDFGSRNFDKRILDQCKNPDPIVCLELINNEEMVRHINNFIETENHLYFDYTYGDFTNNIIYDKNDGKVIMVNHIKDDLLNLFFYPKLLFEDNFITPISVQILIDTRKAIIKHNSLEEISKNLQFNKINEILDITGSEGNPILIFTKISNCN